MARMKTLQSVLAQIEALKGEADRMRTQEREGVLARIQEAIDAYGITARELDFVATNVHPMRRATDKPRNVRVPKPKKVKVQDIPKKPNHRTSIAPLVRQRWKEIHYADNLGNEWTGMARKPRWLQDHLNKGRKLEEFQVTPYVKEKAA